MRWPHRNKSETRSVSTAAEAPASAAAPAPPVVRASGRDWLAVPALTPTITTTVLTTTDSQTFVASIAMAQPMVHAFEPRHRSADGPSGTLVDAADARRLQTPSAPEVLHRPSDLPRMRLRKAPVADGPPATYDASPVELIPAPARTPEPEPELDGDPEPSGSEVATAAEPRRRVRPNLGQSRRLGLGAPVSRLPEDVVPQDMRDDIQAAYGVDVSDAVIRRDDEAASEARDFGAAAFARGGNEVVLPADLGSLDEPRVRGALAHELTHIAQQRLHGTNLPDELSAAGAALEAAARAAEQRFRGDANAPSLERSMRDEAQQWLSSGLAKRDANGNLVFLPRSAGPGGVQRAPAAGTTPDYKWQTTWLQEHHPDALPGDRLFAISEPTQSELDSQAAGREDRFLGELVQFRTDYRRDEVQGTGQAGEAEARRRFRELPAAQPAPETPAPVTEQLNAQQQAALDEARGLQARLAEAHQQLEHEKDLVQRQNRAVQDVDNRFPLRNFAADADAHTKPEPVLPADARAAEDRLTALRTEHPTLVHYFPVSTNHPERSAQPTAGGTTTPTAGGPSLARGAPAPVGGATTTPTAGGRGTPPARGGGALGAAAGVAAISWEAGVFSPPSAAEQFGERSGQGSFSGLFDLGEPTAEEREQNARLQEQQHLPELRVRRSQKFRELAIAKANDVRRELFGRGQHVPDAAAALAKITAAEWQAIIDQVETEMPLSVHQLTDENRLIADTVNSADLIALVTNAPASRDPAPAAGGAAATPTATPAATPAAATTPAAAADAHPEGAPTPTGTAAAATTDAAVAAPAAQGEAQGGPGLLAGGVAAVAGAGLGAAAERNHLLDFGNRRLEEHEIDLSPELLNRLTAELYPKLRSRLRTELIVDRERAGLLPDFR